MRASISAVEVRPYFYSLFSPCQTTARLTRSLSCSSRRQLDGLCSLQQPRLLLYAPSQVPLRRAYLLLGRAARFATSLDAELASHHVHSQASDPLVDEPLLRYYVQEWDRYTTGASYVTRLFTYLNRHWVKRENDEGRKNVYPVYIVRYLPLLQDPR